MSSNTTDSLSCRIGSVSGHKLARRALSVTLATLDDGVAYSNRPCLGCGAATTSDQRYRGTFAALAPLGAEWVSPDLPWCGKAACERLIRVAHAHVAQVERKRQRRGERSR